MNYKVVVEYDGSEFVGWQSQKNGRAVQDVIEAALGKVLQEELRINAAGRTDSGVHARGQVINFHTDSVRRPDEILRGTNANLPPTVAFKNIEIVSENFNARKDAIFRRYQYQICHSPIRPVVNRSFQTHVCGELDYQKIQDAIKLLKGKHDFSAFRSVQCVAERTLLTLEELDFVQNGEQLIFNFGCRSFLMNMIRIIMGTLVEIGQGRFDISVIDQMFESGDRSLGGKTLGAEGLTLMEVVYP